MRNHASAAHPNQNDMSGLKLASFLEDCIRYVLSSEPSGPIITVKSLLRSVRTEIFKKADLQPIVVSISTLPEPLANSFLKSLVGLFCDDSQSSHVRTNILGIASAAWGRPIYRRPAPLAFD